ncbi:hypothetical protein V8C86DRAFT_2886772 [Haematococcus lacustris]
MFTPRLLSRLCGWATAGAGWPAACGPTIAAASSLSTAAIQEQIKPSDAMKQQPEPSCLIPPHEMERLTRILMQPMPLGRVRNSSINHQVIQANDSYFINPEKTLQSVIRMLCILKQVLKEDGHVYILNSNLSFRPLMRAAAMRSTNANVWWHWRPWQPGLLGSDQLFAAEHQPLRAVLAARQLEMVNVHRAAGRGQLGGTAGEAALRLSVVDKWRLWSRRRASRDNPSEPPGRELLRRVMAAEVAAARLPLRGALPARNRRLMLLICLDLSHGAEAVQEAYERGVLTCSVLNAHSPLDRITYPLWGAESSPDFNHFLCDWILRVANLPDPEPSPPATQLPAPQLMAQP